MTTIVVDEDIKALKSHFTDGRDLALSLWALYKEDIIKSEQLEAYYDIRELKDDEVTDEMLASIKRVQAKPKSSLHNL